MTNDPHYITKVCRITHSCGHNIQISVWNKLFNQWLYKAAISVANWFYLSCWTQYYTDIFQRVLNGRVQLAIFWCTWAVFEKYGGGKSCFRDLFWTLRAAMSWVWKCSPKLVVSLVILTITGQIKHFRLSWCHVLVTYLVDQLVLPLHGFLTYTRKPYSHWATFSSKIEHIRKPV